MTYDDKDGLCLLYPSLVRAAEIFSDRADQTVESNQIILKTDYSLDQTADLPGGQFLGGISVPVTVKGIDDTIKLYGPDPNKIENDELILTSAVMFDMLILDHIGHIYCNGNNITMGEQIRTVAEVYLYGAKDRVIPDTIGSISVLGGRYTRIAGYARNTGKVEDVTGKRASITVDKNAVVDTIIAGTASAGVENADVEINVKGRFPWASAQSM